MIEQGCGIVCLKKGHTTPHCNWNSGTSAATGALYLDYKFTEPASEEPPQHTSDKWFALICSLPELNILKRMLARSKHSIPFP